MIDTVEYDPNVVLLMLVTSYLHFMRRRRNLARPLLMDILIPQRPAMYTRISTNNIITSILSYDDAVTRIHLRISSKTFIEISKFLPNKNHGWGPEMEVLIFLLWLACGTSYRMVGAATDISRSTICDIVHKMLDFTVENIMPQVITLPNQTEINLIGYKLNRRARTTIFDKSAGAIDGTHIEIICPVRLHNQYINRKLKYSIQCQAVCDHNLKFLDVFIGYPGSVHDSRVLYCSPLFKEKLYPPPGYYLLGDSGYPCRVEPIPVITPFKERNINEDKKKFNEAFSAARNVIECAFGRMKIRWRSIFARALQLKIENIVKTVAACCTFHNICIITNDDEPIMFEINRELFVNEPIEEEVTYNINEDQQNGIQFRNVLFQRFINGQ